MREYQVTPHIVPAASVPSRTAIAATHTSTAMRTSSIPVQAAARGSIQANRSRERSSSTPDSPPGNSTFQTGWARASTAFSAAEVSALSSTTRSSTPERLRA